MTEAPCVRCVRQLRKRCALLRYATLVVWKGAGLICWPLISQYWVDGACRGASVRERQGAWGRNGGGGHAWPPAAGCNHLAVGWMPLPVAQCKGARNWGMSGMPGQHPLGACMDSCCWLWDTTAATHPVLGCAGSVSRMRKPGPACGLSARHPDRPLLCPQVSP